MVLLDVSKRALDTRQAAVSSDKWNTPNKYLNACEFLSFQVSKREKVAVSVESQLPCGQNFRESSMSFFTDVTKRLTPITPTWMPRATPVPEEAPVKISKFMECLESKGLYLLQTLFTQTPELWNIFLNSLVCTFYGTNYELLTSECLLKQLCVSVGHQTTNSDI